MILVGFLILALTFVATIRFSFLNLLKPASFFAHQKCLERLPTAADSIAELQAIVCGENFSDAATAQLYALSGLIHLFVVSGAHLILLEKILSKFLSTCGPWGSRLVLALLFFYVLACDLNPPITRSFVALSLGLWLTNNYLRWPENFKILLSGLIALTLNPAWLESISLQLSWIAALAVSVNALHFSKNSKLKKQAVFFVLLAPLLIFFQTPNPLTILINFLLAPFLELVLFPLGLVVWLVPQLSEVFDVLLIALKFALNALALQPDAPFTLNFSYSPHMGWTLIFFIHFFLHFKELEQRRELYV